jgi:hypothetical protein
MRARRRYRGVAGPSLQEPAFCVFVFLNLAQTDLTPASSPWPLEIILGVRTFLCGRAGEGRCGFVTLANPKEKPP